MTLGKFLKESRQKSNLKLKDVAKLLQVSYRFIKYIESGERYPSYEVLNKLCKLYQIEKLPIL